MKKQRVLFVDDDKHLSEVLSFSIEEQGHEVVARHSVDEALSTIRAEPPFDAIITDLRMPGKSGMDLVKEVCAQPGHPPILVLTAHGSVDAAVEAMRLGAADFLTKPIGRDVLSLALDRVLQSAALRQENEALRKAVEELADQGEIIGRSKPMRDVLELVDRVAPTNATVLIHGESGTGKELIAKRLHEHSLRKDKPFVALNCAALPKDLLESELFGHTKGAFTGATSSRKGRFVEADGGTLFLDEIGDLDLDLQAKLLRVLQEGVVDVVGGGPQKVNVRIIVATHRDLEALAREGAFRADLYFRIRVVPVELPPLRARGSDIGLLFAAFVARAAKAGGRQPPPIDPALIAELSSCPWPGNVRELENVATRMVVTAPPDTPLSPAMRLPQDGRLDLNQPAGLSAHDEASIGALQEGVVELPDQGVGLEEVERALIVAALSRTNGNRSQAARLLRIPRHVLIYRLEKYLIEDDEVRALAGSSRAPLVPMPHRTGRVEQA